MAKSKKGGKNPQKKIVTVNLGLSWLYILIISGIIWMLFSNSGPNPQKTEWADVKEMIESGDVKDIVFVRNDYKGEITIRPDRLSKQRAVRRQGTFFFTAFLVLCFQQI